jgi:hypothetical protein
LLASRDVRNPPNRQTARSRQAGCRAVRGSPRIALLIGVGVFIARDVVTVHPLTGVPN